MTGPDNTRTQHLLLKIVKQSSRMTEEFLNNETDVRPQNPFDIVNNRIDQAEYTMLDLTQKLLKIETYLSIIHEQNVLPALKKRPRKIIKKKVQSKRKV